VSAEHRSAVGRSGRAREVLDLFDAKAAGWAGKYAPGGPLVGRLSGLSRAVSLHTRAGDRVLDLGCGTGELARTLAADGLLVTGCDISPQMLLRAARDPGGPGVGRPGWVRLEPGWRSLPFASAAFHVVVASSVLEYMDEPTEVLRECTRVLRPGGCVLYTVPDLRHPVRWAEWAARRLVGRPGTPSGARRSRWDGYVAYLRASRQRHRVRWWLAASELAGLNPAPCPAVAGQSSLRLLALRRPAEEGMRP
jgi:SAM-dependent methyltransferase